ncbi:hypothetical protein J4558_16690 [Leptolyngbya sp. 15MV]|nr:hypothetical protein J4558_16690 [Leptolyngbya sp. 15MV]
MRAFDLEADVRLAGGALSASPSRTFADPILGSRALVGLSPDWSVMFYGDIGGFGAGSDLTVVAAATVNYRVSRHVTLSAGYRSMWLDYDDDGTLADLTIAGPLAGLAIRF